MCIYCLLRKQKCRLKTTTTIKQMAAFWPIRTVQIICIVSYPIRNSPDSGFFACELWKDCIMPSSQKQITELKGEHQITGLPLLCFDYKSTDSTCACIYVPKIWIANKLPNCILQIVPIVLYFRCTHCLLIQILGFVNWVNCILQIAPIMSYLRRISSL